MQPRYPVSVIEADDMELKDIIRAQQDAAEILESLEFRFGSYRTKAAKILRSARLRLKGQIISDQWAINNAGRMSGE